MQANLLAFLGMELGGVNIILPNGGGEGLTVGGFGGDDGRIARLGIEAVDEKLYSSPLSVTTYVNSAGVALAHASC